MEVHKNVTVAQRQPQNAVYSFVDSSVPEGPQKSKPAKHMHRHEPSKLLSVVYRHTS